jgi:beta-galactosidase
MKSILTLITLGFTTLVFAQAQLPPEIEDPECLGINLEPPHATLMPYASMKEALAAKRADSSFSRSLNGLWKFNWVEHPAKRPVDFFKPDFDVSGWKEIPVPSCWQLQGYGTPYYRNLGYIFQKDWPRVKSATRWAVTGASSRCRPVGRAVARSSRSAGWIRRSTSG